MDAEQLSQVQLEATDTSELVEEVHQLRADNNDLQQQLADARANQEKGASDINAMAEDAYQEVQNLRRENGCLQVCPASPVPLPAFPYCLEKKKKQIGHHARPRRASATA